uniref:Secreted protein n=1 Tax=Angiostrongylus cantonensis TaxID=6313 RepID=A0A0K0CX00_ANGCA
MSHTSSFVALPSGVFIVYVYLDQMTSAYPTCVLRCVVGSASLDAHASPFPLFATSQLPASNRVTER